MHRHNRFYRKLNNSHIFHIFGSMAPTEMYLVSMESEQCALSKYVIYYTPAPTKLGGGYNGFTLSVCVCVCLSVDSFSQNLQDGFL